MTEIIGRHPVLTALKEGQTLETVFIQDSVSGAFEKQVRSLCKSLNIPLKRVPKVKLDRRFRGNHQGIYAVATEMKYYALDALLESLKDKSTPILLLLDGVQDVRNLGAIARSAEVFGIDGMILPTKQSAHINDVAIKTSAGALLQIPVCRVRSLQHALDRLGEDGYLALAAEVDAPSTLEEIDLDQPLALIMGAEGRGVDRHLKVYCDHIFRIPQFGKVASLNVSVATGIILYEITKLRKQSLQ